MPSRRFSTETTGVGNLVGGPSGQDWNDMLAYERDWLDLTWAADTISLPSPAGDGKFRAVGYTGNQNLTTIVLPANANGTVFELTADTATAGGSMTIVHNGTTIVLARGINIVLDSPLLLAQFRVIGTTIVGWQPYAL